MLRVHYVIPRPDSVSRSTAAPALVVNRPGVPGRLSRFQDHTRSVLKSAAARREFELLTPPPLLPNHPYRARTLPPNAMATRVLEARFERMSVTDENDAVDGSSSKLLQKAKVSS